jgi:hypothetical protein
LEPIDGGRDRFALREAHFFPEHTPRDVVGQYEREGDSLAKENARSPAVLHASYWPVLRAAVAFR